MRKGIRFCPNNAAAHNDLGVALELYGDHVAARIEFNRAIRLDSGYRPAHDQSCPSGSSSPATQL